MKKKIFFIAVFLAAIFIASPIMNIDASALSTPLVEAIPTVSGISYGETAGKANVEGGVVVDAFSGETLEGEWKVVDVDAVPKNGETVRVTFDVSSIAYSDIILDLPIEVIEVEPTWFQSIQVAYSSDNEDKLTVIADLILTNPTSGEMVPIREGDLTVFYRASENEEWQDVTGVEFEISKTDESKPIKLKFEYAGMEGCYLPFSLEREVIPSDYMFEDKHDYGPQWTFLGIVVFIIMFVGYVVTPVIIISLIVIGLILIVLGGIATALLLAAVIVAVVLLIVQKKKKKQ